MSRSALRSDMTSSSWTRSTRSRCVITVPATSAINGNRAFASSAAMQVLSSLATLSSQSSTSSAYTGNGVTAGRAPARRVCTRSDLVISCAAPPSCRWELRAEIGSLKPCLRRVFHFHGARPERWLVLHRTLGSEEDCTTLCLAKHYEPLQEQHGNGAGCLWCSKLNTVCKPCEVQQYCYNFGRRQAVSLLILCFHLVPRSHVFGIPSRFMVTTPHQRC